MPKTTNPHLETGLRPAKTVQWTCCTPVVRHRHQTPTENSKPSNSNELLPQSPPFHAKGRRSTDPITNARAKVRTAPGMALDTVKSTFQSIVQTPPFNTKQDSSPSDRPRKTKLLAFLTRITITTIYTNKYMDI